MIFKRKCWKCERSFYAVEGFFRCPACSALTTGIDNVEEKPETPQKKDKYWKYDMLKGWSLQNQETQEIPAQEKVCLDRFCKARIPDEVQSYQGGLCGLALESSPMNPAQLAAQAEAEQGRSSLQRIFQLLNDSYDLLYNARQLLLEADREVSRMQRQPTQPQNGIQYPSNH